jgi:cell division septation protein DedD
MLRVALLVGLSAVALNAQTRSGDSARRADHPVIQRARQLAQNGREPDGRRLVDSVLTATPPDQPLYAEALYWRASNASTAADAERDYRRLLIESPLSPRAEDALLQLANLEQARGDRRGASDLLQRFLLTYANSPARPRVAVSLVRLLFEQGPQQQARACEALRAGRETIPRDNLELRNQLEYYAPRCQVIAEAPPTTRDTNTPAPVSPPPAPVPATEPATTPAAPAQPPSRPATESARETSAGTAFYSVQVAAYETHEAAARLVAVLTERGIQARVDGTERPFRVRIGRYETRADAVKAAATLKSQGHNGFVTLVTGGR